MSADTRKPPKYTLSDIFAVSLMAALPCMVLAGAFLAGWGGAFGAAGIYFIGVAVFVWNCT
jgi:hypothetical protein